MDREIRRQLNELSEFVDQAKEEGLFAADVPTSWLAASIDALIWAGRQAVYEQRLTPNDAAAWIYRTLVDGLGS